MMKDSVIILSGGMDSTTLLYDQQERIALAISFDYGSNHNAREIPFARLHCERLKIRHVVIPLGFMHQYFKSSLLEAAAALWEAAAAFSGAAAALNSLVNLPQTRPSSIRVMSALILSSHLVPRTSYLEKNAPRTSYLDN